MNTNSLPPYRAPAEALGRLLQKLLPPPAPSETLRLEGRLLLFVMLAVSMLLFLTDLNPGATLEGYGHWIGYLALGCAYLLLRARIYRAGIILLIASISLSIFATIARAPGQGVSGAVHYLVLSLVLGGIFLTWRGLAAIAALQCTGLLLLPLLFPTAIPTYAPLIAPLAIHLICLVLLMILLESRARFEHAQRIALQTSEERLRLTLDAAAMGTWQWDIAADILTWSEYVPLLFGLPLGTAPRTLAGYLEFVHPGDRAATADAIAAVLASGQPTYRIIHRVSWPDERPCWIQGDGRIAHDTLGRPTHMLGTVVDITARRLAETAQAQAQIELARSEQRFRALIDHCADAVALVDPQGNVLYISPAATRMLGYATDETSFWSAFAFVHPDDRPHIGHELAHLAQQAESRFTIEARAQHRDGSWHWIEVSAVNSLSDPAISGIVVNIHDVTERKLAEIALRASEERHRVISELVSDYAFAYHLDPDGTAVLDWVTDAMTRITGYTPEEMRSLKDWQSITHPEDIPIALQRRQRLHAGQPDVSAYRMFAKDGQTLWLRYYSRPVWDAAERRVVRVYGAVQDITKLKQLEQQLSQAQKMEAIGQLAGGIAHDFNNLLTVILGNIELMLAASSDDNGFRQDAEQIQQAAEKAAALTSQLLAFSRQQVLKPRQLDLNTVVENMSQLLRRMIGEDIELVTQLAPDLGLVQTDPGQIEQVIMNLAVNARDAMPTGGMLTIATANITIQDTFAHEQIGIASGSYTMLMISDTGIGMDAVTRMHIFEPFFTTKAIGKGTGLGLAMVHGIITQSSGQIWVSSEPGQGTIFRIYLPRADAVEEPESADSLPVVVPQGDATILLVEDEPMLRALAARVLRSYGYQVLEAGDGPAALAAAASYPQPIHLLLTDITMPGGLNGAQLAEQLVRQRPAIKVLYISGYIDVVMPKMHAASDQIFLQKPFTPAALVHQVGRILHG